MANKITPIPLTTLNSAAVTVGFSAFGTPLPHACQFIRIFNDTNEDITISFDGVVEHDVVPAATVFTLTSAIDPTVVLKAGTQIYAKGTAGIGNCYYSGYYLS